MHLPVGVVFQVMILPLAMCNHWPSLEEQLKSACVLYQRSVDKYTTGHVRLITSHSVQLSAGNLAITDSIRDM